MGFSNGNGYGAGFSMIWAGDCGDFRGDGKTLLRRGCGDQGTADGAGQQWSRFIRASFEDDKSQSGCGDED